MNRILACALLLTAAACAADREIAHTPGAAPAAVIELLEALRTEFELPGLAVVVADDRTIVTAAAAGSTRIDSGNRITPVHRFHIGSISKPVTSTAIGLLVDRGILDWDDRILDVMPMLATEARPEYASITLRQLLAHTAGIQPFEEDEEFERLPAMTGDSRARRLAFAKMLLTLEPVASPGTVHEYSNAGYTIAAAVAEHVCDESFESLLERLVFEPLGLASAGYGPPVLVSDDEPSGHVRSESGWTATGTADPHGVRILIRPAGDLHMNLVDLAKFGSEHLRGLNGLPGILEPSTLRALHTVVLDGYGLGWNVRERFDSHLGGLEGQHTAVLLIMKNENRVYAAAVNAEIDDTSVFGRLISTLRRLERD
ncbi:MAG: serine hydrolase domain-containing protein [Woeseiaceae bacterium]|nr:serine hydrolase domain-containing protein [Woeseiaceae bacterium]